MVRLPTHLRAGRGMCARACVCVCVCVRARVCARVCVCKYVCALCMQPNHSVITAGG